MFDNIYLISIKGKDLKRFLNYLYRRNIRFINIVYSDNKMFCKIDEVNYKKIVDLKTTYEIKLEKIYGIIYIKKILKDNIIFIISFLLGIFYLLFLCNVIFKVDIIHDDKDIRNILEKELKKMNIRKYSFVKSYDYIEETKKIIKENNKDQIEWLEIERIGTKYIIRVEKRINNKEPIKNDKRHLIAKKTGIIKKIDGNTGEIIKKINDYVIKGETIISGEIHKGEDVKDNVCADGSVYAEVWYKVKVSIPLYYYEEHKTGKELKTIKIKYLNTEHNLFNTIFKSKKSINNLLFSDFYNMFSINYSIDKELFIKDVIYSIDKESFAIDYAKEKILNKLDKNEYIITQKKLKTIVNDSTINVEVFFKVYENISDYLYY